MTWWITYISILHIFPLLIHSFWTQYNGDQVLRLFPVDSKQVEFLKQLVKEEKVDLWRPQSTEGIQPWAEVDARIPASVVGTVRGELEERDLQYKVLTENIQDLLDHQFQRGRKLPHSNGAHSYTKYHPMAEIYSWMEQMKETHKDLVTQHLLGVTYQNRPMYYLKIGRTSNKPKKIIWMDCGIHAREWIAPAFCQWFVKEVSTFLPYSGNWITPGAAFNIGEIKSPGTDGDRLDQVERQVLETYTADPETDRFLQNIDFYVLPVLNIDGYVYTWTTERLWRKSMSPCGNSTCFGTDLNRNFDAKWCSIGASRNCCSEIYCGSASESEPETKAVADFLRRHAPDVLGYLTIHSYGQLILTPYGYTNSTSSNHKELMNVGLKAADALYQVHGTKFKVGPTFHALYYAAGTSCDWAADLGINFSYLLELRDNGTHHFILPEDQIQPCCEETMVAVTTIIKHINDKHFQNSSPGIAALWSGVLVCSFLNLHFTR